MLGGAKRRSPTWQQSLLLVIVGLIVGYPSCVAVGHGVWGGQPDQFLQSLYVIAFLAGAVAFIAGFVSFFAISVKTVTSSPAIGPAAARPRHYTGPISRATHPELFPDAGVEQPASVPSDSTAALVRLHVAIGAVLVLDYFHMRQWGGPPLGSSYGRQYWMNAVLTLVLSQLPYAVVLIRTWRVPDRAGLALAMAAGATSLLVTMLIGGLRYTAAHNTWWLSDTLTLAVVGFAYLAWKPSFSRKGDVGMLVSIFFGLLAYTAVVQISLAILSARMRVP